MEELQAQQTYFILTSSPLVVASSAHISDDEKIQILLLALRLGACFILNPLNSS